MEDRRLQVNPELIRIVQTRAGESKPPVMFMVMERRAMPDGGSTICCVSVHRQGCEEIPEAGTPRWTVSPVSQEQIAITLDVFLRVEAEVNISCRSCGGWE